MPKPYGEDSSNNQLSHWIDRAVQAEFRAEKFETALSKEVLAVIQKAAQVSKADESAELCKLKAEVEALEAKIDRLTEAGYAMAIKINAHGINDKFTDCQKLLRDWTAAAKSQP